MLDDHAHVMQVKLCKANTRGVTFTRGSKDVWGTGCESKGRPGLIILVAGQSLGVWS